MNDEQALTKTGSTLVFTRAAIGLVQGLALYLLFRDPAFRTWPATDPAVFAPLLLISVYVPLIALLGVGAIRMRTLVPLLITAAAVIAGLAYYDIWRAAPDAGRLPFGRIGSISPSGHLILFTGLGLFAVQALVTGAETDRRWIASYPTHFDVAWKLALQLQLAFAFVGIFWLLLFLGSQLFLLIEIRFLRNLITKQWFAIPVSTLALAVAIHLTDVRAALVRGMRTVVLALNAWLLPVMSLFVVGFLTSLLVTGIEPLWATRRAAVILLGSAAVLIILINAAYQDGIREHLPPYVLRLTGTVASLVLLPLMIIAAYALMLRVRQYGWTDDRILVAACALVGAIYAFGYGTASIVSLFGADTWLKRIEPTNVIACFAAIATLLALLSPIADPARLSVASQMERLRSGAVLADAFDYNYLRRNGARFGLAALQDIAKTNSNAAAVRSAEAAVRERNPAARAPRPEITPQALTEALTLHTSNRPLPETFMAQDWRNGSLPYSCTRRRAGTCHAFLVDVNRDQTDEVLVMDNSNLTAYSRNDAGRWEEYGRWNLPPGCARIGEAIQAGEYEMLTPEPPAGQDLSVLGLRLPFVPERRRERCPPQ